MLRAQVMSGLRWTVGARILAQVVTWAITLVVIRILTPADYGLLAMATICVAFLSIFSELGLGTAVVQRVDIDVATLRNVFGTLIIVHGTLASFLALIAPLIASFFDEARIVPIVRVLALQLLVAAFGVVPDALLQRKMDFRRRSLLDLSGAIAGALMTLGLALAGHGVWALVIGALFTQSWKTIGVNLVAPFPHWPRFSLSGLRSLVTFGGHISASQLLWFFYSQSDMLIAGKWLGKELLGFYSVAMHLASLPNQRIAAIVNQIAFPAFSRMQGDARKVAASMLVGVRVLSLIAFAVLWGLSSIAPEVVNVILGSKWGPAVVPLQVLGLVMPLRMIGNFVPNAVQGMGRSDIILKNAATVALIGPTAFLIGVNWGLLGLSAAWLVATPLLFAENMMRSLPVLGLRFRQLVGAMWPAASAGLLMYFCVSAARLTIDMPVGILRLAALIAVGALTYIASSFVLNRRGLREAYTLFHEVLRPKATPSASD
jgi:teichuronic acid exporter